MSTPLLPETTSPRIPDQSFHIQKDSTTELIPTRQSSLFQVLLEFNFEVSIQMWKYQPTLGEQLKKATQEEI